MNLLFILSKLVEYIIRIGITYIEKCLMVLGKEEYIIKITTRLTMRIVMAIVVEGNMIVKDV